MDNTKKTWKGLVFPCSLLLAWFIVGSSNRLNTQLCPTLKEIYAACQYLWHGGLLLTHIGSSLMRVFLGFGLAILVGIPLGLVMGCLPQGETWFGPTLHFFRQIPPTAWIPVFLLWFGIGEGPKLAVIFYAALFPIIVNTALGVQQIPREYWEVTQALCLSPWKTLRTLILPGSYGAVFTGLRLGMGMSWRAIVAAEMLASTSGLGFLVMSSRATARVDEMFAGIIFIGLIGVLIDLAFLGVQNYLVPALRWRVKPQRGENLERSSAPITAYFQEV